MPNKMQLITELSNNVIKDITNTPENWLSFLDTASNNYKYSFNEQILIYAQRPDATVCTDIDTWNKRLHRWIKKGSKGIALITNDNGVQGLRHIFDISDTYDKFNRNVYVWQVEDDMQNEIIETLENRFGDLENKDNLADSIINSVTNLVEDNFQDYYSDFTSIVNNSYLEELDELNLELYFKNMMKNSISYMVLKRCGIDPKEYFDVEDFRNIVNFNTTEVISRLGIATSDIAEVELHEIYTTVLDLKKEKNKSHTFVNNKNEEYHEIKENENQIERGNENERTNNIPPRGRLSDTRFNDASTGESTTRDIRKNEGEIYQGEQEGTLHRTNDERNSNTTPSGNREISIEQNGTNNQTIGKTKQSGRTNESSRPNDVGGIHEQLQESSTRNSNAGVNLQLNLFTNNRTEEQQKELINDLEAEQSSVFTFTQEMIDNALTEGSHFENGKFRIYKQFMQSMSSEENVKFLKYEYGIGGASSIKGFDDIGIDFNAKGITLNNGYKSDSKEILLSWSKVEKRIKELIMNDRYLSINEVDKYLEWEQKEYPNQKWMFERAQGNNSTNTLEESEEDTIEIFEPTTNASIINEQKKEDISDLDKNYRLKGGNIFHFHTNEEGYYYEIYDKFGFELDGGLLEYSDNEENETLMSIRKRLAEFTDIEELSDENLEELLQEEFDYVTSGQMKEDGANKDKEVVINNAINAAQEIIEENNEEKIDFKIGQIIYLESDRKYRVEAINKDLDALVLLDVTMLETAHYPITRNISLLQAISLYQKNELNFKQQEPTKNEEIIKENKSLQEKINYHIKNDNLGEGTPRQKVLRNIEAIKLLNKLESENRLANNEEQEILSQYVGWGGLPDVFDETKDNWHEEYMELKSLLTDEEYSNARASTLTAFYTPPIVIKSMYQALSNMGLKDANILEPSCGIGNFFGLLPQEMQNSKLYGVELDSITGRIAKQLYQSADIKVMGYEKTNLPDSFYDVAIGNVPFGDLPVLDKRYDKNKFMIHDYFFAKTLDKVRPGGIIAFITSKGTMDKENPEVRKYIAQRANLIGAIRLPENTFTKNAGTKVTSDIIFLQKRDNMTDIMPDWVYLDKDENGIKMNKYFVDNPNMILGNMKMDTFQFGRVDSTCKPYDDRTLEQALEQAIPNLNATITDYQVENEYEDTDKSIPADPNVKNFSYTIVDGKIYFRENSKMHPQDIPLTSENRIKGMIRLREQVRELIDLQMEDYSDEEIHVSQAKLNDLYDRFTKEYGLINSRANATAFQNDSSYFLLCSLEKLDGEGNFKGKADIFTKRTIKAYKQVDKVDTSEEALILSLSEKAVVDLDYMSELTDKSKEDIIKDLEGIIFKIPNEDKYVAADEYLSGNVREKLKVAEHALQEDSTYQINVDRLKEVVPKDLSASEIGIKLGAIWIPTDIVRQFMFELLDTPYYNQLDIKVRYNDFTSEWYIDNKSSDRSNVKAYSTYGTSRINAYKIIEQTLNLKDVKIFDTIIDEEGRKQRVLNKKETAIAQAKQDSIKQAFLDWVWQEPERRESLTRLYNDRFNSIRPREYDGSHLNFVGMNPEIKLRPHQVNAIAHILYGNNVLLAHEVGAGKTFEMVAAAMESKRLGLCNKSLFVVPNHIIEQFASEFLQLYPSANILVATKKDFETKNRKKFCSRIATGDYDAVIIGHSQFEKIPMSIERQREQLEQQISDILKGIDMAKRERGENFTIKQLEKSRRILENKLEKLNTQDRKDDVITFEELGIDKLFVDEAHNYKNLFLYTKMRNVGGIAQTEAQKSSDLFMKCRYLDEITNGKGTVFATGTPVSNSMVELYTMQRYLQYDGLRNQGLEHFDNWASTFGETVTAIELAPEGTGYRSKTRFAKFHNLPELMALFKEVADVQTADTLNLPTPKVEHHNIVVKPSDIQKEMVKELGERAERIRNGSVDAKIDNMLKITNEGRKLALDQRLINPLLEDAEKSKVDTCVENIYDIYINGDDEKLTQLVFCDLSTPKVLGTEDNPYEMEEINGIWKVKERQFTDVYTDLKRKLVEKGIPEDEIAFIHEADNETKKKELFSKVRTGKVRILMGSTLKMGAGTNVQDRLVAIHHLDCPWRPSDFIQRNGRMIRQGNINNLVHVYTYVTEGTFDAYLFQLVEQKQKYISQIMTSKTPMRFMEDIDEKALSYGEIKALATGNPKILEKTNLDSEVAKLKLLKQNFMSQKYDLQDKTLKYFPQEIAKSNERIAAMEEDIIKLQEYTKPNADSFSPMKFDNQTYSDKENAGKKLLECCKELKSMEEKEIGEYRGFKMKLAFNSFSKNFQLTLKNKYHYMVELGTDTFGNITRINNCLESIEKDIPGERDWLDNLKHQLENAKIEIKKEFPQEQELQDKEKRLEALNIELKLNEKDKELLGDEQEEKEDKSNNKKSPERY